MTTIVRELPEYVDAVRQVTKDAFAASELGYHGEADLIDQIRIQCSDAISLVALDAGHVVGHLLLSPASICLRDSILNGMGLAPMSVRPGYQHQGIGSKLVLEALEEVAQSPAQFTLVAGHPEYYPKFGFVSAQQYSISHGFEGMPQEVLFVHSSNDAIATQWCGGRAFFHRAFGPQHVH